MMHMLSMELPQGKLLLKMNHLWILLKDILKNSKKGKIMNKIKLSKLSQNILYGNLILLSLNMILLKLLKKKLKENNLFLKHLL